jgi:hypothetical protein
MGGTCSTHKEVGSIFVVGKAEVKGQLGRRWCRRLDGMAVGGVCLCSFVCLYRKIRAHTLESYGACEVVQQLL